MSALALNQLAGAVGGLLQIAHAGASPSGKPLLLLLATGSTGAISGTLQPNGAWSTQALPVPAGTVGLAATADGSSAAAIIAPTGGAPLALTWSNGSWSPAATLAASAQA